MFSKVMFSFSALALSFVYGLATVEFQVFPYSVIKKAKAAYDALQAIDTKEEPPHFIRYEPDADVPGPTVSGATADADDLIVMTGGFFYRQDLCPDFGCMAWIMSRDGNVLKTWEYDPKILFSETEFKAFFGYTDERAIYIQGSEIDSKGNLIVTFQGTNTFPYHVGVAKFDKESNLLWKHIDNSHHWPTVGPDGRVYLPSAKLDPVSETILDLDEPMKCTYGAVYQEGVRIRDVDGANLAVHNLDTLVRDSNMRGLAFSVRDDCDPYHVNGIDLLNEASAAMIDGANPGDLVVSLRSSSTLIIMNSQTGKIIKVFFGPMVAQHSPSVMPNGEILIFDNLGAGAGEERVGTRILALDPLTENYRTIFPIKDKDATPPFSSIAEGAVNVSPDGSRILVAETLGGRVFEVNIKTGDILWKYDEISDIAPFLGEEGPKLARLQTQGADFMTLEAFTRNYGE
ncbi:arylsulfotransferase family protein [Ruegeria sp. HKCCSP335]|uniref:arylsulfotransferase family protein n=2 Tax=unclassified Ruegeria TaxID=2625375 RepID=UPI001AE6AE19|nr:arylsulfotransferase family protein [Ruegeria sp. HKCCSP335]